MSDASASGQREVIEELIRTAAECRRHLSCDGAEVTGYFTYRKVWDESMAAEQAARRFLDAQ